MHSKLNASGFNCTCTDFERNYSASVARGAYYRDVIKKTSLQKEFEQTRKASAQEQLRNEILAAKLEAKMLDVQFEIDNLLNVKEEQNEILKIKPHLANVHECFANSNLEAKFNCLIGNLKKANETLVLKNMASFKSADDFNTFLQCLQVCFKNVPDTEEDLSNLRTFTRMLNNLKNCDVTAGECNKLYADSLVVGKELYNSLLENIFAKLMEEEDEIERTLDNSSDSTKV